MVVFDLLFNLFRICLWLSVGKELSPWLFICAVFSDILIVGVQFPFGVQGRMWNSIVSVPDRCLFIYFERCIMSSLRGNRKNVPCIFKLIKSYK